MEKKVSVNQNDIPIKHKHIFITYQDLMAFHGTYAVKMEKRLFYQDVGEMFYMDTYSIARIIRHLIKIQYVPSRKDYCGYVSIIKDRVTVSANHLVNDYSSGE